MKKAFVVLCIILVIVLVSFVIFKPLEPRSGGTVDFEAKVTSVDGNWVTAERVSDEGLFIIFQKHLPHEFVFDISHTDVDSLKPGDYIEGIYFPSRIDGDTAEVRCVEVVPQE